MNKSELIDAVASSLNVSKADAKKSLEAVLDSIKSGVASEGKVQLLGFGTFKSQVRSARVGRNPQTGASINIPAKTVTKFSASF